MANIAHAICERATNPKAWSDWKINLPVVVNVGTAAT
jgi:hypothetical protein